MPTPSKLDKAIVALNAQIKKEIAKEALAEHGPAEPMDEGTFKAWCQNKPSAAKLFNKIIDKWPHRNAKVPGKRGRWAAHTAKYWAKATGLGERTIKRYLPELEAEGLIEKEPHSYGGKTLATYIRPTVLGLTLARRTDLIPRLGKPAIPPVGTSVGPLIGTSDPTTTTEDTKDTEDTKKGSSEALADLATVQDFKTSEGGKIEEKKEGGPAATPTATSVAEVWQDALAASYPDEPVKAFTAKEWGQLKLIAKTCPDGSAHAVVAFVVAHWPAFRERAITEWGLSDGPVRPHIGFTTRYLQSAVNLWIKMAGAEIVKPKPQTLAVSAKHVAEKPMTVEELKAAMLAD